MSRPSIAKYFPFMRVKILGQNVHHRDASSALIFVGPDKRYNPLCHRCGCVAHTIHSKGHIRLIRDLDMASARTWLQVEYRKIWCDRCRSVRVEQLSFVDAAKRVTHRMARYIHELCKKLTVSDVADHLDLDPKTVKDIDKAFLEESVGQNDYSNLRILMIDEIAVRKGHNYMTVVADYFTGRVVWMGKGRNKKTLDAFFETMTEEQKQAIEAVAMDMWEPFINRVQHYCPNAGIVFDFFHLVQSFGKVIDQVRRSELQKARESDRQVIKGSRYLLLKNEENLSDSQRNHLKQLLEINDTLNKIYILKDQLKLLYYYSDRRKIKKILDDWCEMAMQIDHFAVERFVGRLMFFEYGILNHADYPVGTSMLEGINNKIKVIKRKAYGFHDDRYFALKVKQACAA